MTIGRSVTIRAIHPEPAHGFPQGPLVAPGQCLKNQTTLPGGIWGSGSNREKAPESADSGGGDVGWARGANPAFHSAWAKRAETAGRMATVGKGASPKSLFVISPRRVTIGGVPDEWTPVGASMRFKALIEYLALQLVLAMVQILPMSACARLCRGLAWLVADVIRFRHKVIDANILGVFPDMPEHQRREMARKMWYHLCLMGCEIAQAPRKIHDSNWRKHVYIRDKVLMTRYLIDYRPLVAVSGHYGNFEMGGYVTGLLGMPSYTVARTLDNPYLDEFINRFRGFNGQFILPKDGSAGAIQEVLESGGILTLLGDQHAGTKGCWVDFLGRPASCHKAVALFTLSGTAPMMVSYCRQTEKPLHFEIGCTGVADPLDMEPGLTDVKTLTQWYNDRLADAILAEPEQFWWVHRRWKEKPVRKTRKMAA